MQIVRFASNRRVALPVAVGAFALLAAAGSVYVVQPTEMAAVRRFGVLTTPQPVGPGLHGKLPFVDNVDRMQVSLTTFQVADLAVYTIDNQPVHIGIGLTFRVPRDAVFRLLYGVGRTGNVDIEATLRPIVADRALRVFARRNTISISAERQDIAAEIRRMIQESVRDAFGIDVTDVQLIRIEYSASFQQSVEAAVRAKNEALQAENTVNRVRYEGEQAKVQAEAQATAATTRAEGEARAAVARARGERESAILRAQGEAQALALLRNAEAEALQHVGAAVAANPAITQYEAARRWNGTLPATIAGGTVPLLNLATPAATPGR